MQMIKELDIDFDELYRRRSMSMEESKKTDVMWGSQAESVYVSYESNS